MGMVMLPPGVTWQQYNDWLQNSPEGQQYAQYINQASAGIPTGVSHSPPMPTPGGFRPRESDPYADVRDLMQRYPGVDPAELRRFRENQRRAAAEGAASRFREDSQQYDPEYRREADRRRRADELAREQKQLAEQWKNSQPGRAQPIRPQSQGTPLRPPVAASPAAPGSLPGSGGQPPQKDFGHQYYPWAGATRAPGQPLNRGGPSIGPTKYIGRDGTPMYAR